MNQDRGRTAQLLALSAMAGVILAPPEVFGSGRMLLVLCSTFALLILMLDGKIPSHFLWSGVAGTVFLVWHALWISIDAYRSVEFFEILWSYYCLFGVFYYTSQESRVRVAVAIVLLSVVVSTYGIYEFVWGNTSYTLSISADTNEIIRTPILDATSRPRIMSTFAMPGTLWGFLLIALPFHAMLWKQSRTSIRTGLALSVGLGLTASALTRSFGFVAGLLAVVLAWLLMRPGDWRRRAVGFAVIGLLVLLGTGIYSVRAGGYDPVSLRLQNWLTAVEIFAAYPFGTGLNNFAVAYLQHQQLSANESQYAHNTPLQLLSETGAFGLVAGILLVVYLVRHRRGLSKLVREDEYIALALVIWIVHNLIDIDLYFASVGAVGVILLSVLCASMRHESLPIRPAKPLSKWVLGSIGAVSVAIIVSSGVVYVSGELLRRAQTELSYLEVAQAHQTLESATTFNPFNSSILHEAGQVALEMYQDTQEGHYLEQSREYFADAVRLSPNKVGPHLGLALTLSTVDRTHEALAELEIAQYMHPYSRYVSSLRRLVENRQSPEPPPEVPEAQDILIGPDVPEGTGAPGPVEATP